MKFLSIHCWWRWNESIVIQDDVLLLFKAITGLLITHLLITFLFSFPNPDKLLFPKKRINCSNCLQLFWVNTSSTKFTFHSKYSKLLARKDKKSPFPVSSIHWENSILRMRPKSAQRSFFKKESSLKAESVITRFGRSQANQLNIQSSR